MGHFRFLFFFFLLPGILPVSHAQPPCVANPAANDYCSSATPICNLNGYCGNTSSSYTNTVSPANLTNETFTPLGDVFCATIQNNSWLKFIADSTVAVFDVWVSNCANNKGIQMQIYATSDCYNFTPVSNCWNPMVPANGQITATGLIPGDVYYFMIDGTMGDVCDYVIASSYGVTTAPTISEDQQACAGDTVTLTVTGGVSYVWSSSPADASLTGQSTNATIYVHPDVSTTYTVTVTNPGMNNFCPNSTNILSVDVNLVQVQAHITENIPASCGQNNGSLTCIAEAGSGLISYCWNTNPPQSTASISGLCPGEYTVTASSGNCMATVTSIVGNIPLPVIVVTATTPSTCSLANGSASVTVTGGQSPFLYLWNTVPAQHTAVLQQVPAGAYSVLVTDSLHCSVSQSVIIDDFPGPLPYISNVTDAICGQSGGSATVSIVEGQPPYTYLWNSDPMQTTPTAVNLYAGTYQVTVTDNNNCSGTASATVLSLNSFTVSASAIPDHCNMGQGSAVAEVEGGGNGFSFLWSTGDTTAYISGLYPGFYFVTVYDDWCEATSSVYVNNIPGVEAGFTANPTVLTVLDKPVSFYGYASGKITEWYWDLGDGTVANDSVFTHHYPDPGTYLVSLIITDGLGCKDTVTDTIFVRDYFTFYVPNSFTPDGDGMNDIFTPYGINIDPAYFEMDIFNRWGNLVYHTDRWLGTQAEPWNGTLFNKGGLEEIVPDVYVYLIKLKELEGIKHQYTGKILIVR